MKKLQAIFLLIAPILPFSFLAFNVVENLNLFITFTAISTIAMILYLIHLYRNSDIERNFKVIYFIALLFAHTPASYVYWFQYVKKDLSNP